MEVKLIEDESVVLTLDGNEVRVRMTDEDDGPVLRLEGLTCNLEGEMPGEYWLTELKP